MALIVDGITSVKVRTCLHLSVLCLFGKLMQKLTAVCCTSMSHRTIRNAVQNMPPIIGELTRGSFHPRPRTYTSCRRHVADRSQPDHVAHQGVVVTSLVASESNFEIPVNSTSSGKISVVKCTMKLIKSTATSTRPRKLVLSFHF